MADDSGGAAERRGPERPHRDQWKPVVKVAIDEGGAIVDANPAELARARAHGGETTRSKFVARFVRSIVQSWLGGDFAPSADGVPSNGARCLVLTAVL